ncbi:unnamed protein product, partial [Mesorhabditis spiculigera]
MSSPLSRVVDAHAAGNALCHVSIIIEAQQRSVPDQRQRQSGSTFGGRAFFAATPRWNATRWALLG